MSIYVPGTDEKDPKKIILGLQQTAARVEILREWHTWESYGGIGNGEAGNSAINAAAMLKASTALRNGGKLFITPGNYACDPVVFAASDGGSNFGMTIEGFSNVTNGAYTNSLVTYNGTGSGTFWNFDSPAAGSNSAAGMSLKNLYFYAADPTYTGSLISSSTPLTDGSKITYDFLIENCVLRQEGTGACVLLNVGKSITGTTKRNHFIGGATQILGQQGLTVAGSAQARQNTTLDIRKCQFSDCNGYPILFGGEAWGLYDNIFEQSLGGKGRAFATNSNYPILGMTWINNWFGDLNTPGDQWIVVFGSGFNFYGNVVNGFYTGGTGSEGISLNSTTGFDIRGNTFTFLSTLVSSTSVANNFGEITSNNGTSSAATTTGAFGASVRVANNFP